VKKRRKGKNRVRGKRKKDEKKNKKVKKFLRQHEKGKFTGFGGRGGGIKL